MFQNHSLSRLYRYAGSLARNVDGVDTVATRLGATDTGKLHILKKDRLRNARMITYGDRVESQIQRTCMSCCQARQPYC
jgi:hypothetical protein